MSGTKITKADISPTKAPVRPPAGRDEPMVRWPSAATGGGAAYGVTLAAPKSGTALPEPGAEG
jgi:hypothetical protein